jgi:hydrocephalus-inducing protein
VFRDELALRYESLEAFVTIIGEARNNPNVYLSKSSIDIDPTYITLSSQYTMSIINKTKVPVEFEWRAFANEREENEKKQRLNM